MIRFSGFGRLICSMTGPMLQDSVVFLGVVQEHGADGALGGLSIRVSGCHGEQFDGGIIADRHECLRRHAATLDGPFVVLLQQERTDEPGDGRLGREHAPDNAPGSPPRVDALGPKSVSEKAELLRGVARV
jgi:hypothetical protein